MRYTVQYKDDIFLNVQKDYFKIYVQLYFQGAAKSLHFVALRFLVFFFLNTALLSACYMRRSTSSCKNAVTLGSQIFKIKQGMVYIYCDGLNKRRVIYKVVSELKTTASCS